MSLETKVASSMEAQSLVAILQGADDIAARFRDRSFRRVLFVEHGSSTLDGRIRKGGMTLLQKAGHDLAIARGKSQADILRMLQESPACNHQISVDPHLSDDGRRQAKVAAGILMDLRREDLLARPDDCYTSEMNRTIETAEILGFRADPLPHFNERVMMPQAGLPKEQIARMYPEIARQMRDGSPLVHEGIEEISFFQSRIAEGIRILQNEQSYPEDDPAFHKWEVVVAHQTVIKILIASALENAPTDLFAIDVPNCSITPLLVGRRPFHDLEKEWYADFCNKHRTTISRGNFFDPKVLLHDHWSALSSMPVTATVAPSIIYKEHCDSH